MDQQSISLNDAADIFRRRWPIAATVALVVFLGTVVTAFTLENVYRSVGAVSVTEPERRPGFDPPPLKPLDLRILELTDEVIARDNLIEAVEKFNLFPDDRIDGSASSVAGLVRANFEVELKRAEVDPASRNPLGKVIGITTTFYYKDPRTARDVGKFFLDKFVEAKDARLSSGAIGTVAQFEIEAGGFEERLRAEEEKLARFKEQYPNAMPDQQRWNMQQIERKSTERERVASDIRSIRARIDELNRQLANTPPNETTDEIANRQAELQAAFIRLLGLYTADHPEVRRVRRQLETLLGAGSNFVLRQMLEVELRNELEKLGTMTLGERHPERLAAERRVLALRQELDALPVDSPVTQAPTNPAYLSILGQLRAERTELSAQQDRTQSLGAEISELEASLVIAPRVEQELQGIMRDIDLLREQLRNANNSLEVARTMVDRDPWETWTTTYPRLNFKPAFPNRPLYVILSAFVGLTLGIGAGLITEALDGTIRGTRDVRSVMQMPPIAAIPVIKTASDQRRDRLRLAAVAAVVIVAVGAVSAYAHFQMTAII